jgi:hypothetical protein
MEQLKDKEKANNFLSIDIIPEDWISLGSAKNENEALQITDWLGLDDNSSKPKGIIQTEVAPTIKVSMEKDKSLKKEIAIVKKEH